MLSFAAAGVERMSERMSECECVSCPGAHTLIFSCSLYLSSVQTTATVLLLVIDRCLSVALAAAAVSDVVATLFSSTSPSSSPFLSLFSFFFDFTFSSHHREGEREREARSIAQTGGQKIQVVVVAAV